MGGGEAVQLAETKSCRATAVARVFAGRQLILRVSSNLMRRAEVLQTIGEHRAELHRLGVKTLSVFGSVARDEAHSGSDVDLLVEFEGPVGYFHLFDVQQRLESLLGARVDIVTPGGLRPEFRDEILAEAIRAA